MIDLKSKAMELIKHLCGEKILCESKFLIVRTIKHLMILSYN